MKDKVSGFSLPKVVIAYARENDRLVYTNGGGDIGSRVLYVGPVLIYDKPGHSKMSFYIDGFLYGEVSTAQGFQEFASTAPEAPYDREVVSSKQLLSLLSIK
ncbi:hypothetical protein ILUMI_12793 [Ignelater luminosus]|uniref:Uncharacterized protein n=1 Tax=Ignelater luminosus TaxID=2038154 RepID=A0A8K0GBG9_IGNLU|nr:hypothetical protein ILUMI_12793 [Ignelater luminosus]